MALQRTAQAGLNADSPPDQLGNGALYLKNMVPVSASSVRPRPGVDLLFNFEILAETERQIRVVAFADDPDFTTFIVCTNQYDSGAGVFKIEVEGIFECHLGETTYNLVVGFGTVTAFSFSGATPGLNLPTAVQFGNRAFVYYPDERPVVIMQGDGTQVVLGIPCGIQAAVGAPFVGPTSIDANNLTYDADIPSLNVVQVGYCYYSSARNVYSQPSPLTTYIIPASPTPPKKLLITGFFTTRDDATASLIDFIVVCVRSGINGGLFAVWPEMYASIDPELITGTAAVTGGGFVIVGTGTVFLTDFATGDTIILDGMGYIVNVVTDNTHLTIFQAAAGAGPSPITIYRGPRVTFDLSPDQLTLGIDLNALAGAMFIQPAVRYCERYNERIWLAAQLPSITFTGVTLTVQKALLDGTIGVLNGSADLTGTGTNFDGQLEPFDSINIYAENTNDPGNPIVMVVGTIVNDTSAIMTSAWQGSNLSNLKAARIYRGNVSARLEVDADIFSTAHLYYNVYREGIFIGQIFDVLNSRTAFMFGDVNTDFTDTLNWELQGANDRIWPSSYSTATLGNVPTVFPECVQLNDYQLLTQALDQGQALTGLKSTFDELRIAFDSSFVRMIGGDETDTPLPQLRQYYGRAGCIAPRSLCKAPTGEMSWIGIEGIFIDDSSGPRNTSVELGCQALWRGGQWIAREDIPGMVMCYSREMNGFVFGNFTINGVAGWWGLLTLAPQYGIFLFDNQLFTSNLIEYLDGNGRGIILGGDGSGRIKRLLYDKTLTDVNILNTSTAAYTCMWREGYSGKPDGSQWAIDRVILPGIIAPDVSTIAGELQFYRTDFIQRQASYLGSNATYTVPFVYNDLLPGKHLKVLPFIPGNMARYHSMGISFLSTAGAQTPANEIARPMEITSWTQLEKAD